MATISATPKTNSIYRVLENGTWVTIYYKTDAGSVIQSNTKVFLNPDVNTINGKKLGSINNGVYTPQAVVLESRDIEYVLSDSTKTTIDAALDSLYQSIDDINNDIAALPGSFVTTVNAPGFTAPKSGAVDLTPVFNKYLPLTGGTLTGNLNLGNYTVTAFKGKFGTLEIDNGAVINGNLVVNGTTTTVNTENLEVKDKVIVIAKDNAAALTTPAGIIVPKYDGTNYGGIFFDRTGTAYVGDVALYTSGDNKGNIDITASVTTALPIAVLDKALYSSTKNVDIVGYDAGDKCLTSSGISINTTPSGVPNDNDLLPYGAMKTLNLVNSVTQSEKGGTITFKTLGSTIFSATFGTAAKLDNTNTINDTASANDSKLPDVSAVKVYVKSRATKIYYQTAEPTNAIEGDIWIS